MLVEDLITQLEQPLEGFNLMVPKPKVLVTGSRNWWHYNVIKEAITNSGCTIVIHGGARGADTMAGRAATELGLEVRVYPADWEKWGKADGTKRNQEMIDAEHVKDDPIELCLAFPLPDSRGTVDMIRRCKRAGIETVIYAEDGSFTSG